MEDGYYSIRPMHKLDMGLNYASGNVNITGIGTSDSLSGVTSTTRWKISHESTGYVFMNNGTQSRTLYPSGGSSSAGASVIATTYSSSNTAFRWTMEKVSSINGLLFYDINTGEAPSTARGVMPGQTLSQSQLNIAAAGYTSDADIAQNIRWTSSNTSVATINSSTGAVTGVANGSTTITATYTAPNGSLYDEDFVVVVSPLPISGYELAYNPNVWNSIYFVKTPNCYSYALNNINEEMQPGAHSIGVISKENINAENLIACISADAQALGFTFEAIGATELCPEGTYKVALVCDPGNDYHWYRQNPDGTWSHKRGQTAVNNYDASNILIYNPETANRLYETANYSVFVGYFFVSPL